MKGFIPDFEQYLQFQISEIIRDYNARYAAVLLKKEDIIEALKEVVKELEKQE